MARRASMSLDPVECYANSGGYPGAPAYIQSTNGNDVFQQLRNAAEGSLAGMPNGTRIKITLSYAYETIDPPTPAPEGS